MKRFFVSVLTVIGVLLLLGAALTGFIFFHKYVPTNEPADQNEWFGVVGDRVAIILDNQHVLHVHTANKFKSQTISSPNAKNKKMPYFLLKNVCNSSANVP